MLEHKELGEKIGKSIDQGINKLGSELEQGWDDIHRTGKKMGVPARVYARLHWDKALQPSTIDIEVPKAGTVCFAAVFPPNWQKKAVQFANDTVDVDQVIASFPVNWWLVRSGIKEKYPELKCGPAQRLR